MHAYDIEPGAWADGEPGRGGDGWCFGLPPGIAPEQWPLDPMTGHPLLHGFTLKLPEAYRVHGPEIVALSFFATPAEGNDGGRTPWNAEGAAIIETPGATPPADPALHALWSHAVARHPRLHRMRDILDYGYAIVLLDAAEYAAPCCRPPASPAMAEAVRPQWLDVGGAAAFAGFEGREVPAAANRFALHRPLILTPRADDPNAGRAPEEAFGGEPTDSGYVEPFYWEGGIVETANYREHAWAKAHRPNHLGGTMQPVQGIPDGFTPFHIGFEEELGGYNFGGGNAQLDFSAMRFDWACG